jgi:hypothetical protein
MFRAYAGAGNFRPDPETLEAANFISTAWPLIVIDRYLRRRYCRLCVPPAHAPAYLTAKTA